MRLSKIAYWIFTILLILLMLYSAYTSLRQTDGGISFMKHLGYPYSVLYLLSVAKFLGIIVLLIPGFPRLKEWAYAGFAFDLFGVLYAGLSAGDSLAQWTIVIAGLIFLFGSYFCYHQILKYKKY